MKLTIRQLRNLIKEEAGKKTVDIEKMERLLGVVEDQIGQMKLALMKYKEDSQKYEPQLSNITASASSISSAIRVILRLVGVSS